jgi:hypothetical protein
VTEQPEHALQVQSKRGSINPLGSIEPHRGVDTRVLCCNKLILLITYYYYFPITQKQLIRYYFANTQNQLFTYKLSLCSYSKSAYYLLFCCYSKSTFFITVLLLTINLISKLTYYRTASYFLCCLCTIKNDFLRQSNHDIDIKSMLSVTFNA